MSPTVTPNEAALLTLFWSLLWAAIGYGLCAWRVARLEARRRARRRAVEAKMLEVLSEAHRG